MGLDFTWIDNKTSKPTISLSQTDFLKLVPYFNILDEKSGVLIDGYTDIKLSPEHANILYDIINNSKDLRNNNNIENLINMLMYAKDYNQWINITGE